jgi:hypothetical protein
MLVDARGKASDCERDAGIQPDKVECVGEARSKVVGLHEVAASGTIISTRCTIPAESISRGIQIRFDLVICSLDADAGTGHDCG